ncbi:histidine triad nucleotide-binding protein [Aliikangiella maris]|uniref:Histidine triad nucleotide-binding protein n=2 Tax=Aliikangiella maris TaxID=3162458 RepID=A0ABV2BWM2_9GAMM
MDDCLFCKINQNQIPSDKVYEDDDVIVIKDIAPKAKVHLLVIPKKHIASLNELLPEDRELMGKIMLLLPELAKAQGLDSGFRTIINTGKGGGQEVFHIHVHLLGGSAMPFA